MGKTPCTSKCLPRCKSPGITSTSLSKKRLIADGIPKCPVHGKRMQPHALWPKNNLPPRELPVFICLVGDCPVFFAERWGFCELEFDGAVRRISADCQHPADCNRRASCSIACEPLPKRARPPIPNWPLID